MKELNISKTITAKRKEKAVTQDELAAYIGVSKASVSKWETGLSYPDITFLPQLAAYFNISIDELLGYEPQMTKGDISKLYKYLTQRFSAQPFDDVMEECQQIIRKYYSCFPLLMAMAVLFLNHYMLVGDKERQEAVLKQVVELCKRIKTEEHDTLLINEANSIEAVCALLLGQPEEVIELLEGILKPTPSNESILASAYHMKGEPDKSKEVLQVGIYQHLMNTLDLLTSYMMLFAAQPERFDSILYRVISIADLFELDSLNPGLILRTYLCAAQGYAVQNRPEESIGMLDRYTEICIKESSDLTLHGDKFFDSLEKWFSDLDFGGQPPRDAKVIKTSMLQAVDNNPAFAVLMEYPRYKSILDKLKNFTGG